MRYLFVINESLKSAAEKQFITSGCGAVDMLNLLPVISLKSTKVPLELADLNQTLSSDASMKMKLLSSRGGTKQEC